MIYENVYTSSTIEKMNYSTIKDVISKIDLNTIDYLSLEYLSNFLIDDGRKNVQTLGHKLLKLKSEQLKELNRVRAMYEFDRSFGNYQFICGVDEVGRGPLAGPIVAAAVILNNNIMDDKELILYINDSKKLSKKVREELSEIIKEKALSYSIAELGSREIDSRGIAWCNNEVLRVACTSQKQTPDFVVSDGYPVKNLNMKNSYIVKGDSKSASIACASIIAKVYRDNIMCRYSEIYPQYGFEKNAGYGTQEHVDAIRKYGICELHRLSFLNNIL